MAQEEAPRPSLVGAFELVGRGDVRDPQRGEEASPPLQDSWRELGAGDRDLQLQGSGLAAREISEVTLPGADDRRCGRRARGAGRPTYDEGPNDEEGCQEAHAVSFAMLPRRVKASGK